MQLDLFYLSITIYVHSQNYNEHLIFLNFLSIRLLVAVSKGHLSCWSPAVLEDCSDLA